MTQRLFSDRIFCFNPESQDTNYYKNRTVYHYTSPAGLMAILKTSSIRFTDCEYLNDKSEYKHIHIPLEKAFEEVRNKLYDTDLPDLIENYINDKYDYSEIVTEKPELGLKGLKYLNTRHFVFCASTDKDALNMWNYYVKGANYQGYNIGLSVNEIVKVLSAKLGNHVKLFYGQVIYNDKEKIEILKNIITKVDADLHEALQHRRYPEDYDIFTQTHQGELISYIDNFRLFFKDSAFSSEKEYRFVLRIPDDANLNLDDGLKICYDIKQGIITPYCDMILDKTSVIKRITISPMIENQLAKSGLERFLKDNLYDHNIDIDTSRIPIRY